MISVFLQGGLGNQMFQCAAAIAYAIRHNMPYVLPNKASNSHKKEPLPYYFSGANYGDINFDYILYNEKHYHYTEIPFYPNICLQGYFQSEKYFVDQREAIIKAFAIPSNPVKETVAIHVRRGDYLNYPTKHPVVSEDYLLAGINTLKSYNGELKFIFFSDDIYWCKRFVETHGLDPQKFTFSEGKNELEDLEGISNCEHQIISNSTFGWWGAWLNPNPNKIVIVPEIWFGEDYAANDTKDLFPASWIKLNNKSLFDE